jgi:hypothetical protein
MNARRKPMTVDKKVYDVAQMLVRRFLGREGTPEEVQELAETIQSACEALYSGNEEEE